MENHDIIFQKFEFTHGINKPKIVIFQANASKYPYQTLNNQIEQLKIKVLFNLGSESLKLNIPITVKEQPNPPIQEMKKLAMLINDYLFDKIQNVGVISGSQINNSIKLYLTFLHIHGNQNYMKTQEYNLLSDEDKTELQQILYAEKIKPPLLLATQSKIQDIKIKEYNQSEIIQREQAQLSKRNPINDIAIKPFIQATEKKDKDQILSPQDQAESYLIYQQPGSLIDTEAKEYEESQIIMEFMPPNISSSKPKQQPISSQDSQKVEKDKSLPPPIKFVSFTEKSLMCLF